MPAEPNLTKRTRTTRKNGVSVSLAGDISDHVEVKPDLLCIHDHDISRQTVLEGQVKIVCADGMCCVDDTHLPSRVNSRIRAAGSLHVGRLLQQGSGRITERPLDRPEPRLDLPAVVVGAVVGYDQLDLAPDRHGVRLPEVVSASKQKRQQWRRCDDSTSLVGDIHGFHCPEGADNPQFSASHIVLSAEGIGEGPSLVKLDVCI